MGVGRQRMSVTGTRWLCQFSLHPGRIFHPPPRSSCWESGSGAPPRGEARDLPLEGSKVGTHQRPQLAHAERGGSQAGSKGPGLPLWRQKRWPSWRKDGGVPREPRHGPRFPEGSAVTNVARPSLLRADGWDPGPQASEHRLRQSGIRATRLPSVYRLVHVVITVGPKLLPVVEVGHDVIRLLGNQQGEGG